MDLSCYLHLVVASIFYQTALASPVPSPICYDSSGQFPAPAALDCMRAMGSVQDDLSFERPEIFGVYEDATRRVPLDWSYKTCLVTIDVGDASQTDNFTLASVLPAFAEVQEDCIVKKKLGQGFGGYVFIGNSKGFYASVQYDGEYYPAAPNSRFLLSSNVTGNGTASPAS